MKLVLYALVSALSLFFAYLGTPSETDVHSAGLAQAASPASESGGSKDSVGTGEHLSMLGLAAR